MHASEEFWLLFFFPAAKTYVRETYLMKDVRLHQCCESMRSMLCLKSSPHTSTSHWSRVSLQSFWVHVVVGSTLNVSAAEGTQGVRLISVVYKKSN